ncbi:MAG: hypothetical protein H6602_01365 [Flavobacteriales bacterium]|nr:hypothetical protein [Flavobacteriales bacterium]
MKDRSLNRNQLAKQLLEHDSPRQIIEQLLEELDRVRSELGQMKSYPPAMPISDPRQKQIILNAAIKKAAFQMHRAFNTCQVPNAILTTVNFPDGDYRLTFQKMNED